MLLFLIAGYQSDAAEIARSIDASGNAVESALLLAVRSLASGALRSAIDSTQMDLQELESEDLDQAVTNQLWMRLLHGVRSLAKSLLGEDVLDPLADFRQVENASTSDIGVTGIDGLPELRFTSAFSGPHQLAVLLIHAGGALIAHSVTRIKPPPGLGERWGPIIAALAERRPYLWPNHIAALREPMLSPGTSAVISLPTGAGKTTMAELKIASALAIAGTVVYLVPTHALGDQVKSQLRTGVPLRRPCHHRRWRKVSTPKSARTGYPRSWS